MVDIFGTESVNKGLLISIQQFLDAGTSCAMIRTAWSQRNQVSSQLKEVLPRVKKAAESNFELLSQILS
jgi:hypothetical protein